MLKDFTLQVATKYVFGHGAHRRVAQELDEAGITTVMVHHDSGKHLYSSGLLQTLTADLGASGITFVELGGVTPNPKVNLVREGVQIARDHGVQAVIAVGGGSVIDSAKAICLGALADRDVWDFFGGEPLPDKLLPLAVVLTNPASGSEGSQVVVINNEEEKSKLLISDPRVRPAYAFMNPELSVTVPAFPTACGIVDMFSHICERYFTSEQTFGVVDAMAEGALRSLVHTAPLLMADLGNYDYRAEAMWTSTMAQNNMLGVGREEDWSTHVLGNEISALYDTPHGATLSILMCAWMEEAYLHNLPRFARFAREVFGVDTTDLDDAEVALVGIEATRAFFTQLGMPTSFEDMSLPTDGVQEMLDNIDFFGDDRAIGSVVRLNREACERILLKSFQ